MYMLKHVGKLAATDSKCVVVMMQIPGKEDHALICESDSLPDRLHQAVMGIVESQEGQATKSLADLFARRYDPDTNIDILNTLHNSKRLRPVPVDQVYMVPAPGRVFPLNEIIKNMRILEGDTSAKILEPSKENDPHNPRFNPHLENLNASTKEELEGSARSLLMQADLIERDAKNMRERAYNMAPSLRPRPYSNKTQEPAKEVITEKVTPKEIVEETPSVMMQEDIAAMYSDDPAPKPPAKKTTTRAKKPTTKKKET